MKYSLKLISMLCISGLLACTSKNFEYDIDEQSIEITATLHGNSFSIDSLLIDQMRVIDFEKEPAFYPKKRLWGVGQPKVTIDRLKLDEYQEGWFQLINGEIVLMFISEHQEAIYIPTKMDAPTQVQALSKIFGEEQANPKISLLLGTENADEALQAIKDTWGVD